ncbi:hypothetical protein C2G38_2205547 [Gigaspora rosea]|uniref:Uncharacterized protein n=1 Tax=Gigaspora rosea TaxID=44941 RepID=A0A397UK80_9GLOM|nr:hypothetical protein C2G38_2205547 [Gigaspora rosea]
MGIYRSNKRRYQARQAAQKSLKSQEKRRKQRKIQEINEQLDNINYNELNTTNKIIKKFVESTVSEKKRVGLISDIELLPSRQISAATHLFETSDVMLSYWTFGQFGHLDIWTMSNCPNNFDWT